jgi:hypothetical protein
MDIKKNDKRMAIVICSIYKYVQSILYNRFKEIDWPIYCYFVHFPNLVEYNLEHSLSESQDCTWPVLFCYGVPCLIVSIYSSLHCIWSLQGVLTMGHVTSSLSLEHQGFGHLGVPWLGHIGLRSHRSSILSSSNLSTRKILQHDNSIVAKPQHIMCSTKHLFIYYYCCPQFVSHERVIAMHNALCLDQILVLIFCGITQIVYCMHDRNMLYHLMIKIQLVWQIILHWIALWSVDGLQMEDLKFITL